MVVAIIDTATKGWTIAEICLLQGHNMNTLADAGSVRIFSDDLIATNINNVIRFVYANSRQDLETYTELFCVNTLSVIALNNIMHEAGYIPEWQPQDPFDKAKFYEMILQIKEDEDDEFDIISLYRGQYHEVV